MLKPKEDERLLQSIRIKDIDLDSMLDELEFDENGLISTWQFAESFANKMSVRNEKQLKEAFQNLDKNNIAAEEAIDTKYL